MATRSHRRRERGATAVIVAILISVLIGFVALAMNIGHRTNIRSELQNAADAAALAGALELNGTLPPITAAQPQQWAWDFAQRHETDRDEKVFIDQALDVTLGVWDRNAPPDTAFTPLNATTPEEARLVNAVRVRTFRQQSRDNGVAVWMAAFLGGTNNMDVLAEAVAVNGGECVKDCPDVPLTFFDCGIYWDSKLQCGAVPHMRAEMAADPSDTVGFSSLSDEISGNTDAYLDILRHDPDTCGKYATEVGEMVNVSNGNNLTPLCGLEGFNQYCHAGADGSCTLDPRPKMRAPVVDGQCNIAEGILPKFNQPHQVVGFATFTMTKLVCDGKSKYMEFEFLCEPAPPAEETGCGFFSGEYEPQLKR